MCHIRFTLHVYDLTVILGDGVDGAGVTGESAAKSVAAVRECVSALVSVEPLTVIDEGLQLFNIFFNHDTMGYFSLDLGNISNIFVEIKMCVFDKTRGILGQNMILS